MSVIHQHFGNGSGVLYGKPAEELKENPLPEECWKVRPSNDHMKNFFDCVRSRETPVASAELEHRSITACHLTNISIRLGGRKIQWDAVKEEIISDAEANAMLKREQRKPYLCLSVFVSAETKSVCVKHTHFIRQCNCVKLVEVPYDVSNECLSRKLLLQSSIR